MNIQHVKRVVMGAACIGALLVLIAGSQANQPNTRTSGTFESVRSSGRSPGTLSARAAQSPGIAICADGTAWDLQHNDDGQKQIATLGGDHTTTNVHFVWTYSDAIPESVDGADRYVNYNGYNPSGGLCLGDCGSTVGAGAGGDVTLAHAGYGVIDVMNDDNAFVSLHQRNNDNQDPESAQLHSSFVFDQGVPCFDLWAEAELAGSVDAEAIWPHGAIDRGGSAEKTPGDDVFHVASHTCSEEFIQEGAIYYWRRVGRSGTWEGPVVIDDNAAALNHHVATDPTTEDLAIIYEREDHQNLRQVGYIESNTNGADWISDGVPVFPAPLTAQPGYDYVQITGYSDPNGPQAWLECTGEYDLSGELHIIWVEQRYADESDDCQLRHWSPTFGIKTITRAYDWGNAGDQGTRDLWLAYPQIGFGDGSTACYDGPPNPWGDIQHSNRDYIYVTLEQYGGPSLTEASDVSFSGYQNLDYYITVSNDDGYSWSPPINLTDTKTPGCNGGPGNECASERDPSLALVINDAIHIMYVLDEDAGDAVNGQGSWTLNPVMYHKIPGGDDNKIPNGVCPVIAPSFSARLTNQDPDCEYNATYSPPGQQVEDLIVSNFGNAPMSGVITVEDGTCPCDGSPPPDWLTVAPGGPYATAPGDSQTSTVIMNAGASSIQSGGEGLYQAHICITHNDTTRESPHCIPVDFFVFDQFYCTEYATLHTGGGNEGTLWLEVGNTERFGNRTEVSAGLSRIDNSTGDSSWSVYDGSLIIGLPPNPDTTVFRNIYGEGRFQPGFRAIGPFEIDTSAYGTGQGEATASAVQRTSDSLIGVDVEYVFPQDVDSSEFVIIRYEVYNRSGVAIPSMTVGAAVDFDVMPGNDVGDVQEDARNTAHHWQALNLVYQHGADTLFHNASGQNTATRFKAGLSSIQPRYAPRAWLAQNDPYLTTAPGGGFHEGYLYREMQKPGWEILPPYDGLRGANIHAVMIFEQNASLGIYDGRHYVAAIVSDNNATKDAADLIATTGKAWKYAFGWLDVVTEDSVPESTEVTLPYFVVGTHEDGLESGCCGCEVSKVSGRPELTINPDSGNCEGTIHFSGGDGCVGDYSATFRAETPECGGEKYAEDIVITIHVTTPCECECPYQCDHDMDGFITALDLGTEIDILFGGVPDVADPLCPTVRGDFDFDTFDTPLDLAGLIDYLFRQGPPPCDPCDPGGPSCAK
jgi:hypothetical protein